MAEPKILQWQREQNAKLAALFSRPIALVMIGDKTCFLRTTDHIDGKTVTFDDCSYMPSGYFRSIKSYDDKDVLNEVAKRTEDPRCLFAPYDDENGELLCTWIRDDFYAWAKANSMIEVFAHLHGITPPVVAAKSFVRWLKERKKDVVVKWINLPAIKEPPKGVVW